MGKLLSWITTPGNVDDAKRGAIKRAAAIREIENTEGFRLIVDVFEKQREWAVNELTRDLDFETTERLRQYLKALDVLRLFLSSTKHNGKTAEFSQKSEVVSLEHMDIDAYHALVFQKQ